MGLVPLNLSGGGTGFFEEVRTTVRARNVFSSLRHLAAYADHFSEGLVTPIALELSAGHAVAFSLFSGLDW